ncbi:MAG: acyl-CoA thioester hydrolase [Oscillospiraceae bacterium]|nr:acyl-CoA thioester hydrolase [Oscillospiraceae bacterium]
MKVKNQLMIPEIDGFYGVFYPNEKATDKAMIVMLGDSSDDRLAVSGAKWIHDNGCHALAMSPSKKDYGHHNYPLERFGAAIAFLKNRGINKIGIAGASTTGMLALIAASYYPEITLTLALSPSDFVMEGFYRDGKDGMKERPGDNESTVSWQGKSLPYLPFAYRHPEYWQKIEEESKAGGDMVASRKLFDESEIRHPLQEEEKIKVENIKGQIVFVGAEDDVLWDTCKYIRRMEERLDEKPHDCSYLSLTYEHGTHFVFPESLLKKLLPFGGDLMSLVFKAGREHPSECRAVREDIDRQLSTIIRQW